jgi:hypothetical protein
MVSNLLGACNLPIKKNQVLCGKYNTKPFHLYRDAKRMLPYFHVLGQAKIKALDFWLIFGE